MSGLAGIVAAVREAQARQRAASGDDRQRLAAKRRKEIAQRVSAGVWRSSMPQPRRGGMFKLCRRFAAKSIRSHVP